MASEEEKGVFHAGFEGAGQAQGDSDGTGHVERGFDGVNRLAADARAAREFGSGLS